MIFNIWLIGFIITYVVMYWHLLKPADCTEWGDYAVQCGFCVLFALMWPLAILGIIVGKILKED